MTVRNTLVAHDDFTEISPSILTAGMNISEEDFLIPTSITISNKCIAFPIEPKTVQKMQLHAQSCCSGVHTKLIKDIEELRKLTLSNPGIIMAGAKYKKDYGEVKLGGAKIEPPNFMSDPWLDAKVPDFSDLHQGYTYEEARVNKVFYGPETIVTPKGSQITLEPNKE